jgi:hypothetical protein
VDWEPGRLQALVVQEEMKNEMRAQQPVIGDEEREPFCVGGRRLERKEVMPSEAHMYRTNEGE